MSSADRGTLAGGASQALAVHVFLAARGEHAEASYRRLRELWAGCAEELGTTAPIPDLALPAVLPEHPLEETTRIRPLAAASSEAAGEIVQALVLREHDVYCLAVMIAPDPAEEVGWSELEARWTAVSDQSASSPPDRILGEARVFLGLIEDAQHKAAAASCPSMDTDPGAEWWRHAHRTASGLLLWEDGARADERALRRFVALARRRDERLLDAWVWTRGEAELPPFGRYLMHMARIRYELRVYAGGATVRRLRDEADGRVAQFLDLLDGDIPSDSAELLSATTRLGVLRVKSAGLIAALTGLREMRRTVQIAASNMAASLGGESVLRDDRALTDWFEVQLADDALYVEAACDRTREVADIASTVMAQGIQERREAAEDRRNRFSLLQTAIIGAIVMVLTAVQALGYQIPLPGPAKAPLVAVLGAITLLLALLVLRLASSESRTPQAWVGHACAGLTAAATVWLLVAWLWSAAAHHTAPDGLTASLSGLGFAVGTGASCLFSARRSTRR